MTGFHVCLVVALAILPEARAVAQAVSSPSDGRYGIFPATGLLIAQPSVSNADARQECLTLPVKPPNDRLQGPHGGVLFVTRCAVSAYEHLSSNAQHRWTVARYQWTSVFSTENPTASPRERDTTTEEEVVLLDAAPQQRVRAIWHARYDTGPYGMWRSITPEVATTTSGTTLLSVMSCVNGTGGCSQDFLHRHANGEWFPVLQKWMNQLPRGYAGRIKHGVRIEPQSLRGEAGFYGGRDPNCCPSETLVVDLDLRGDSLVLRGYKLRTNPQP
ncbi:MAG TPA: hypothetical protein VGG76_06835 [Gemmatimonadaceae bacterium]|jgi:hypothetical protein